MLSPQFEEAEMKWRLNYLAIALLLTMLDAAVIVYSGTALWAAWSGDVLARGMLVLFTGLGATSLANVWVHAVCRVRVGSGDITPRQNPVPISAELRGQSDV
jgi:hypothetical protein